MGEAKRKLAGPDLARGVALTRIADGAMLLGHVRGAPVLLARRDQDVFAIGATCAHAGAPLVEGLMVGETVRCPWHHACFSLRTGDALRAPALDGVSSWQVEQRGGRVYVGDRREQAKRPFPSVRVGAPESIVIVGGGAAGNAAAETLRREGYAGPITMVSADSSLPCDRPHLSKGYLSGTTPAQSDSLRSPAFYRAHRIDVRLGARVVAIDTVNRQVRLVDGSRLGFDALLLATGAEPVRLEIPGAELPHVHHLRTLADARALVAGARTARRAVVLGASFIGLEVAASLRARGLEVDVVAPDSLPMATLLGPDVGAFLQQLHQQHGVTFHLTTTATAIDARGVALQNGDRLAADLVVVGIGVRPAIGLAEEAGIAVDRGITVNGFLETSALGVFAAGDIARWPDRRTGECIRVEHWVVAQRQGQTAARNMLGGRERFFAVPFFWTAQYDVSLSYVGHAERWDRAEIDGQLDAETRNCTVTYRRDGTMLAAAFVQRDREGLRAEVELERIGRGTVTQLNATFSRGRGAAARRVPRRRPPRSADA